MTVDQVGTHQLDPSRPETTESRAYPSRRRTWIIRIALLTAIALVIAAIGVFSWAKHYQPLTAGTTMYGVRGDSSVEVRQIDNHFGTEYRVVTARPGGHLVLTFDLSVPSDAAFGVTVDTVGSPMPLSGSSSYVGWVDSADVRSKFLGPTPRPSLADGPVRIDPGQIAIVTVDLTMATCDRYSRTAAWATFTTVPVTYSALGITHTVDLPFTYAVSMGRTPTCRPGQSPP